MDDEALSLMRRQRHSFLNHLQVISGWLQMEKPTRAREYLDRVAARMEADGQAVRFVPPSLGLAVLDLVLEAESLDVQIEWRMSRPIPDMDPNAFHIAVRDALQSVAREPGDRRSIVVAFGPEGLVLHSSTGLGEG